MQSNKGPHRYYTAQRADLVDLMPGATETVLEIGCGAGGTGALLRARGCREIVGVEINAAVGALAEKVFNRVLIGNVEKLDLGEYKGRFDCILYGDVLEHLADPWRTLRLHRELLSETGSMVASIPNVRFYRVLRDLAFRGRWEYCERGILDKTHLRFFTYRSIRALFESAGMPVEQIGGKPSGAKVLKAINRLVGGALQHFLIAQYLVVARKADAATR